MVTRSYFLKILIFLMTAVLHSGCASAAHSPYACDAVSDSLNLYGWQYKFFGNITQFGDCAVSKTLKVELGHYYHYHKNRIDWDVHGGGGSAIDDFGLALNCKKEVLGEFKKAIVTNKETIFGIDYDRSAREVTKSTLKVIKDNPTLAEGCK